jgi:hypothetical protein
MMTLPKVSVVLALYLGGLGLDVAQIGAVFTVALAGGAVMTIVLTQVADQLGRRRILLVGGMLMALAGAVFAVAEQRERKEELDAARERMRMNALLEELRREAELEKAREMLRRMQQGLPPGP